MERRLTTLVTVKEEGEPSQVPLGKAFDLQRASDGFPVWSLSLHFPLLEPSF